MWSNLRKLVVTFRAGLPGSCVLPCRPLPPSRVLCLSPVFFNTPLPIDGLTARAAQRLSAGTWVLGGEPKVLGAYVQSASRERPEVHRRAHQVGHRARTQVDRGPMRTQLIEWTAPRVERDVHAAPISVFTGHVSHMRANGPYMYGSE